jgi:CheY-like chemotaxis protein
MSLSKYQNKTSASSGATTGVQNLRVLVVDDNRDAADSMAAMIGVLGNDVRAAYSGYEVPALAESFRPELILLDIGMPGMNGYEVCRELRKTQGKAVHIVALTGYGQESDRSQSEAAGFDEHLVKPITLDSLQRVLGAVKS